MAAKQVCLNLVEPIERILLETMKKEMHQLRLKNAGLRADQTKLQQKAIKLTNENKENNLKVLSLEKKNAADCTLILNQCKELEHLSDAQKLAKV